MMQAQKQRRQTDEVEEQIEAVKATDREHAEAVKAEADTVLDEIDEVLEEYAKEQYKAKLQAWAENQSNYEKAKAELEEMVAEAILFLPCGCH
jgi:hypothetical protein